MAVGATNVVVTIVTAVEVVTTDEVAETFAEAGVEDHTVVGLSVIRSTIQMNVGQDVPVVLMRVVVH